MQRGTRVGPTRPSNSATGACQPVWGHSKGDSGKWRLIMDMSLPEGHSVNNGIQDSLCSLSYVSVDDATRVWWTRVERLSLAKVDLKCAYCHVPIHPEDRWLMGLRWQGSL